MKAQDPIQTGRETEASEDQRMVLGVLGKDRKATAEFVGKCANWIYPFVRRRLVPKAELAEDIVQEILFAAWHALPNFRGDANLRSWVMGIARHRVEDYYRKKIREVEVPEESGTALEQTYLPAFELQMDSAARTKKVQETLAKLPEAYAAALIWQYRDDKSVREMAQLTGKTEKAMERLLARAREGFRRKWNDGQL